MVFCTYCGQSFTRDEHLERHILTHTNVKPFKCFTCHMSFARRDLLQRHYTVHGRDQNQDPLPASNGMIPKSAGRTPIACSNCAKTKTKCDKKFPCSRCAGRNLKCTLRPTRRATKNAARMGIPLPEGAVALPPGMQVSDVEGGQQQQQQPSRTVTVQMASPTALQQPQQQQQSPQLSGVVKPLSPEGNMGQLSDAKQNLPLAVDGPPLHSVEQPTSGPTPSTTASTYSPPLQTPSFLQVTPFSTGFDSLGPMGKDLPDDVTSPRFMLDWSQMQIPMGYDGIAPNQMMLNSDLGFDPGALSLAPSHGNMFNLMSGLNGAAPPLTMPDSASRVDSAFSDLDIQASTPPIAPQRTHSMPSNASSLIDTHSGEMAAIVAAQDAWSVFRCMPVLPSASCPRTAKLNLERLEQTLRNQQGWSTWSPQWEEADLADSDHLTVMQLHESTRDKLLAITQSFLHKALDIHRDGSSHPLSSSSSMSNFILLPPARVLEFFLRSYANCFERYYPLTSRGTLDANELMHCYNDRAASLLVLTMVAQGAMSIPSTDARMLTGGLTETCRISLFDLIEKDIIMAGDPIVLHAALLFTVQAAWSGDKWQMDIAMGQRGMYFAMLRHSGFLDRRPATSAAAEQRHNTDRLWSEWIQNEARTRMAYAWAMVDQDMALFHDTAPLFSITEFSVPMPDADRLWHAKSAAEWSSIFEQVHEFSGGYSSLGSGARPLSLKDLFRHFLDDEMIPLGIETTPLQLRLLLHPLQSLVYQFSQLLSCFSDPLSTRGTGTPRTVSAASTRNRLEEIQSLLQRWFDLAERYLRANSMCAMMQTNLVVFHLISLNAVAYFPDIERLARRENFDGSYQQLVWLHKRCIIDVEEAIFHCGQVLRLVRAMPRGSRPPWWAAAIYRVALVLWTDSLLHKDVASPGGASVASNGVGPGSGSIGSGSNMFRVPGPSFAIDALPADHALVIRYLTKREGVPCVSKPDGSQMPLDRAYNVLQHCVEVIDEGAASRFSDGIRSKLDRLARG